jgi:hypothetical protein
MTVESDKKSAGECLIAMNIWVFCSVGMMVFNKLSIQAFPLECTLVAVQMGFTVLVLLIFCWNSLHIGSRYDLLRWLRIAPLFAGVLLTSVLALKEAPMSLVVVFRCLAPLFAVGIERFYPNPLIVTPTMVMLMGLMVLGALMYVHDLPSHAFAGIGWVLLNNVFAVGDRLMQRLMLAADQHPVDISKTGCALLNNLFGLIPLFVVVLCKGEYHNFAPAVTHLTEDPMGVMWVALSCVVGVAIAYSGIWLQSMISATSFLVLATACKFLVILIEVFVMGTKTLTLLQFQGASVTIFAGVAYGKVRERMEQETAAKGKEEGENKPLLEKGKETA